MNIEALYQHFKKCTTICTDTRKIEKDSLFFALKGEHFNGNEFASQALKAGAKYCVVDEPAYAIDQRYIVVKNVLEALQNLATYHRNQLAIPIIALTGSNGKTTTKELINAVLSKHYQTSATIGNLNNHIGVPLTLLQMNATTEIGIVEMGANHPHEIALLCEIAQPDYGLITNFGKAHLEGFGSVEGVIKAKSELYDYLMANQKTIFVNDNDPLQVKQTLNYKNSKGIEFNQPIYQLLVHVFNHTTYHRGQVVTMLRQVGYTDVSSTDMTTFFRLKNEFATQVFSN